MSRQEQQQVEQAEQVVIQRLNTLEQEILEIRKAIAVTHRLTRLNKRFVRSGKLLLKKLNHFPNSR